MRCLRYLAGRSARATVSGRPLSDLVIDAARPAGDRYPGRRPVGDRAALAGIVFVLETGIAWNQLPAGLVGCSGVDAPPSRGGARRADGGPKCRELGASAMTAGAAV